MDRDLLFRLACAQLVLTACAIPALALAPPVEGRILLLPLTPGSADRLAARAIATGARLVSVGPTAGSLIVAGPRARLVPAMLAAGVLPLAADALACGTPAP